MHIVEKQHPIEKKKKRRKNKKNSQILKYERNRNQGKTIEKNRPIRGQKEEQPQEKRRKMKNHKGARHGRSKTIFQEKTKQKVRPKKIDQRINIDKHLCYERKPIRASG